MRLPLNDAFDALSWLVKPVILFTILLAAAQWRRRFLGAITVFHRSIWRNGFYVYAQPDLRIWG